MVNSRVEYVRDYKKDRKFGANTINITGKNNAAAL